MGETDLGSMVMTVKADVEGFKKDMADVVKATQRTADAVESNAKRMAEATEKVKEAGKSLVEGFMVISESRFFRDSLEKFEAVESAAIRLRAAIKVNGGAVEELEAKYVKFAKTQAEIGIYAKKDILALIQQAEAMGETGEVAQKAAKQAMSLAAVKGMDPSSFIRGTVALNRPKKDDDEEDHTEQIYRILAGRGGGAKDKAEQLSIILKNVAAGEEVMEKQAKTSAIAMEKLGRTFADLKMGAGESIAKGIEPFIEVLKEAAKVYKELNPNIKESIILVGALAGGVAVATSAWKVLNVVGLIPAITSTYAYFTATSQVVTQSRSLDAALGFVTAKEEKLGAVRRASAAAIAGTVVAGAALAYGAYELSKAWVETTEVVKEFNKTLGETASISEAVLGAISGRQNKYLEELKNVLPENKESALQVALKRAEQELEGSRRSLESRKKEAEGYDISVSKPSNLLEENNRKRIAAELQEAQKIVKSREEFLHKLHEEFSKVKTPGPTSQDTRVIVEGIKSQRESLYYIKATSTAYKELGDVGIEAFRGMQEQVKKLYEAQRKGVDPAKLKEFAKNIDREFFDKGSNKLEEDLMDLNKELEKTKYTFGATENEIKLYDLRTRLSLYGITQQKEALYNLAKARMKENEELEKTKKLMEEAKSIISANIDPLVNYESEVEKLNKMFIQGYLTFETYAKAIGKAKDELEKLRKEEVSIQGVLAGSKEAKLQELEYIKMLTEKVKTPLDKDQGGLPPTPNTLEVKNRSYGLLSQIFGAPPSKKNPADDMGWFGTSRPEKGPMPYRAIDVQGLTEMTAKQWKQLPDEYKKQAMEMIDKGLLQSPQRPSPFPINPNLKFDKQPDFNKQPAEVNPATGFPNPREVSKIEDLLLNILTCLEKKENTGGLPALPPPAVMLPTTIGLS